MTVRWLGIVFVALGLLSLVTSASAECAWVLWEHSGGSTGRISTEPVAAHETREACERQIKDVLAEFRPNSYTQITKDEKRAEVYVTRPTKGTSASTESYRYVCLPDTVDPRGPKGK
jgi:hypothetical protein